MLYTVCGEWNVTRLRDGASQHKGIVDSSFLNLATDIGEWSVPPPGKEISGRVKEPIMR
jgi:hypothetical protein